MRLFADILKTLLLAELYFLFKLFCLKYFVYNRPIPDESVINFNQMNLLSNVIGINPSLFRPSS